MYAGHFLIERFTKMARMKDFTNQIRGPYLVLYPTKRRYKNG